MKNLLPFAILFLLVANSVNAQQISLTGRVSMHNSGYRTGNIEYVSNAYLRAAFATSTQSGTEGQFSLVFQGLPMGDLVELTAEKDQLEVVNERALSNVILGRTTPLKIYLAPKGELAKAQTELYEVSLAAITARHDALIAALRQDDERSEELMADLEQQLNREITSRYEAEDILREQLKAAKERLPESTKQLALVNLDFASAQYLKAYEFYRQGEIEKSIAVLDEETLGASADQITDELASIEEDRTAYEVALAKEEDRMGQIIAAYQLKADAYYLIFDYRNAVNVYTKAVRLMEAVKAGKEDMELADAYSTLGVGYKSLGEYANALFWFQKSMDLARAFLPENDPDLALRYLALASAQESLADYDTALENLQYAIAICEQTDGVDQVDIAICYNNLAKLYISMGDYEAAMIAQQQAIVIGEQYAIETTELAPEYNGLISTCYQNLSTIHIELADYSSALTALEKAMASYMQFSGANPLGLAGFLNSFSKVCINMGYYPQALSSQEECIEILTRILEPNHPNIATSYNNISVIYQNLANYPAAILNAEKALAISEQIFASGHPQIATSYNNLSTLYAEIGDYTAALSSQQKNLDILTQTLEADHPDIALAYSNLSGIYRRMGEFDAAFTLANKALTIQEEKLEPNHPNIAGSYSNLASLYADQGNYTEAVFYEEKARSILEEVLSVAHPRVATSYHNLASFYLGLGDAETALLNEQTALEIFERMFEENHPQITMAYVGLSRIYLFLQDFSAAISAVERALAMQEQTLVPGHPDIADTYDIFTLIHISQQDFLTAFTTHKKAMAIQKKTLNAGHPKLASAYHMLAFITERLKRYDTALTAIEKAIAIYEKLPEPGYTGLGDAYQLAVTVHQAINGVDEVIYYSKKYYHLREGQLLPQDTNLVTVRTYLINACINRGVQDIEEKAYSEAREKLEYALGLMEMNAAPYADAIAMTNNGVGLCHYYEGNYTQAIEYYNKSYQLKGISQNSYLNNTGMAYAKMGNSEEAKNRFQELEQLLPDDGRTYRDWALYYALLNEPETALDNLEKAIQLGYDNWEWIRTDKALEPLRTHPRYLALLENVPADE